jgi:hypothetical protein
MMMKKKRWQRPTHRAHTSRLGNTTHTLKLVVMLVNPSLSPGVRRHVSTVSHPGVILTWVNTRVILTWANHTTTIMVVEKKLLLSRSATKCHHPEPDN